MSDNIKDVIAKNLLFYIRKRTKLPKKNLPKN